MGVGDSFSATSRIYDRSRRQLIPCFDDFYRAAVALIPGDEGDAPRILDLGAGTGLLSAQVAASFPLARITLVDVSKDMLTHAGNRLGALGHVEFVCADYAEMPLGEGWSAIVSALSIHHLDDEQKRDLFRRAYRALAPGGMFINAEQILAPTPALAREQHDRWITEVRALGVSNDDLASALERMTHDRAATLADQLSWLQVAGFRDVDCWYKYLFFAVYGGRK